MFDSHDDDLWEVPSIDVDEPVEGVVPAEAAPAAEARRLRLLRLPRSRLLPRPLRLR